MNKKIEKTRSAWGGQSQTVKVKTIKYGDINQCLLREFKGEHPAIIKQWLNDEKGVFKADAKYKMNKKEKRRYLVSKLENLLNIDFSKKYFKLVK